MNEAVVGRLSDVIEEHTLHATTNLSVLRTGEPVHECNGGCADDIAMRLRAVGIQLSVGRAMGSEGNGQMPLPVDDDDEQLALPIDDEHYGHVHVRSHDHAR